MVLPVAACLPPLLLSINPVKEWESESITAQIQSVYLPMDLNFAEKWQAKLMTTIGLELLFIVTQRDWQASLEYFHEIQSSFGHKVIP